MPRNADQKPSCAGLGLAKQFLQAGATVIVTGRRKEALEQAAQQLPGLHYYVNDCGGADWCFACSAPSGTAEPLGAAQCRASVRSCTSTC